MKVSSKIVLGFVILLLVGLVSLWYQITVVHRMQSVNENLSEINMMAATTALRIQEKTDLLTDDITKKYFALLDEGYAEQIADTRDELVEDIGGLQETARSELERTETEKFKAALNDYWETFSRRKQENRSWDSDELPPDLTIAMSHLQHQAEVVFDAVQFAMKEQVRNAAEIGYKAQRISLFAGATSLLLSLIVAAVIVRAINDPLRRLTQGTRAIAKGQFWHRLPTHGSDEFTELARHFNIMTEKLGELDQMKKDFVSHVSHDLKAPLASIRQIMHLLLQGIPGALNDQQTSLIQLSYNSAERLAAMVGNLLDVSRMEAGTMEYQMSTHELIPMIKGALDEFEVQAQEKGIRVQLEQNEPSIFVKCDRERIVQVIGNLLDNALKFSPNDSQIVMRVGQRKPGEVMISVSDSGPGVPDAHKNRIFHKFHQVKHGKKIAGQGVGLGLAICDTIVRAHQGEIWVEDNPDGGSVFSFVLQAAANEEVLKCGQPA
jgi:signal transduction histidine kinase